MAKAAEVSVFIRAVDKTKAAVQSAERGFQRLTTKLRSMSKLQVAALGGLLFSMNRFVKAFEIQEQAEKRLRAAIKNVRTASKGAADELINYAAAMQKVTTFGDEQIISAEAMLATFQLNEKQIKQIVPRLLDMAAAVEKTTGRTANLEQIAIALGKAFTGQPGLLARYGVVLDEAAIKAKGFSGILKSLDDNFKGIAQSTAQTKTGQIRQFTNLIGDLGEKVGEVVVDAMMPMVKFLKGAVDWFMKLPKPIQRTAIAIMGLTAAVRLLGLAIMPMMGGMGKVMAMVTVSAISLSRILGDKGLMGILPYMVPVVYSLAIAIKTLGLSMNIFSPAGWVLSGVVLLVGMLRKMKSRTEEVAEATKKLREKYKGLTKAQLQAELVKAQIELNNLLDKMAEKPSIMKTAWNELKNLIVNGFTPGITAVNKEVFAQGKQFDIISAKIQLLKNLLSGVKEEQKNVTDSTGKELEFRQKLSELEQQRQELMKSAFEIADKVQKKKYEESKNRVDEFFNKYMEGWSKTEDKMLQTYDKEEKALNNYANKVRRQQEDQQRRAEQFINTFQYGLSNIIAAQAIAQLDAAWERSFGRARSVLQQFIQFALQQLARLAAQKLAFTILKAISGPFSFLPFNRGGVVTAQSGLLPPSIGADTVPVLATPGEAFIPRQVVRENRQAVQQLVTQQTINNQTRQLTQNVNVDVTIKAFDGTDVLRIVRSVEFKRAFRELVKSGQVQISVDGKLAEVM